MRPISKRSKRDSGIAFSIGVDGRMYLSSGLRKLLNHNDKSDYYLYYDDLTQDVGISKEAPNDLVVPFTFSSKGEGQIVSFVEDCEIQIPGKPILYLFESSKDGIYVFFRKGRRNLRFIAEKNGNLNRG